MVARCAGALFSRMWSTHRISSWWQGADVESVKPLERSFNTRHSLLYPTLQTPRQYCWDLIKPRSLRHLHGVLVAYWKLWIHFCPDTMHLQLSLATRGKQEISLTTNYAQTAVENSAYSAAPHFQVLWSFSRIFSHKQLIVDWRLYSK